jgi:hypothetical protein
MPMPYEAFRDAVREVLAKAAQGLTWTEVRTHAGLPQAFPNNKWVRRMEDDIHLMRVRDSHGILHWELAVSEVPNGKNPRTEPSHRLDKRPAKQQGRLE